MSSTLSTDAARVAAGTSDIPFTKMHGLGNDYVVVDGFAHAVADPAALAARVGDRHHGVGCDGLLLLLPPTGGGADLRMRMFNPDGSEAEMCGNGIRCACKLAFDRGLTTARPMRVETGAGVLVLEYETAGGVVTEVTVDMGVPGLDLACLPVRPATPPASVPGRIVDEPLARLLGEPVPEPFVEWMRPEAGRGPAVTCASMGNPHAVIFCAAVDGAPLERIGPWLETHAVFPQRINVHLVRVDGRDELTVRSWERGAGATLACGTGACAVAVAAALTGRTGREVVAHLPGGDLRLRWDDGGDHVFMTGPAATVFTGAWPCTM